MSNHTPLGVADCQERQESQMNRRRLHIGFIPFRWRSSDLIEFVSWFGRPTDAEVICNNRGSKGFGFVTMPTIESAEAAIRHLNGKMIDSRTIQVNFASQKGQSKKVQPQSPKTQATTRTAKSTEDHSETGEFSRCLESNRKKIAMSEIQYLRARLHQSCAICQPLKEQNTNFSKNIFHQSCWSTRPLTSSPTVTSKMTFTSRSCSTKRSDSDLGSSFLDNNESSIGQNLDSTLSAESRISEIHDTSYQTNADIDLISFEPECYSSYDLVSHDAEEIEQLKEIFRTIACWAART